MHYDNYNLHCVISIHALLAESDRFHAADISAKRISIHALLAESDPPRVIREPTTTGFLSTLSLRRATVHYDNYNLHCVISIHALLAESDKTTQPAGWRQNEFLSTLSLRRATSPPDFCYLDNIISIHALLAESDSKSAQNNGALLHI